MKRSGLIPFELVTFNLPQNIISFGPDKDLEIVLSSLTKERLVQADTGTLSTSTEIMENTDKVNELMTNYMMLPLVGSESYSVGVEHVKVNGVVLEHSQDKIAYIDSGNTLIAFPKSFYAQMNKVLNLSKFCFLKAESNTDFESLNCSRLMIEKEFKIQFSFYSSSENHSYSLGSSPEKRHDTNGRRKYYQ
jgi:hypothetical protein